jgi:anti-anti-sigma regulatory factor
VTAPATVSASNAQEFWTALAYAGSQHVVIVIDLSATRLRDDRALMPLLMALRFTDASGGQLRVVADGDVRRQLREARLDHLMPLFGSVSDALALPVSDPCVPISPSFSHDVAHER